MNQDPKKEFKELGQELDKLGFMVKQGFDESDKRFERLEKKVSALPDKDFLTAKFADLKGDVVVRARKQDEKINLHINMLARKNVLAASEVDALHAIKVFPTSPAAPLST